MSFFLKTQSRIEKASSPEILSILFFFFFAPSSSLRSSIRCVCVCVCKYMRKPGVLMGGRCFFFFAATRVYVYLIYTHNVYKKRAAMGERRRNPDLHSPLINTRCNITYRAKWSTHTHKKKATHANTQKEIVSLFFFWVFICRLLFLLFGWIMLA